MRIIKLPVLFAVLPAVVPTPYKRRRFAPAACNRSRPGKAVSPDQTVIQFSRFKGIGIVLSLIPNFRGVKDNPSLKFSFRLCYGHLINPFTCSHWENIKIKPWAEIFIFVGERRNKFPHLFPLGGAKFGGVLKINFYLFTHLDKGYRNAHQKQREIENIFMPSLISTGKGQMHTLNGGK